MSATEHPFTSLTGVPAHFARPPVAPYGTRGKPWSFACTHTFHALLERVLTDLWALCPLGKAEVMVSSGAQVPKDGHHGQGEAFDLDALFWPGRQFIAKDFLRDAPFYLGVEAVLRRHFGTVLAFTYNAAHEDHLHVQSGRTPTLSRSARSDTLFVQNLCVHLLGDRVIVDGVWGTQTTAALARAQSALAVTGTLDDPGRYQAFLEAVARRAFAKAGTDVDRDDTAAARLEAVYRVIANELGQTAARERIEVAVAAFAGHPAVKGVVGALQRTA